MDDQPCPASCRPQGARDAAIPWHRSVCLIALALACSESCYPWRARWRASEIGMKSREAVDVLRRAWDRLDHCLSAVHPRSVVPAARRRVAAGARLLDGVRSRARLFRTGHDGPAVWPHGALPPRDRTLG